MGSAAPAVADFDDQVSPRQTVARMETAISPLADGPARTKSLDSFELRADPDAQATVTDFLDFTEHLPSDMMRSLTLVGKLDQTYNDASASVHDLTTKWGQLPSIPAEERPSPAQLRADISENLSQAVDSRIHAHAEAVRMAENVKRHYNRAKTILAKLQTMLENYTPLEEQKSPVAHKSPQMSRAPKITLRMDGQKVRGPRVPRITVPGEVLAPYDLNYETMSSGSESSSEEDEEADGTSPAPRAGQSRQTRIKLIKTPKTPRALKVAKHGTSVPPSSVSGPGLSTSSALAQLQPPPENAVIGSPDAPWLRLTVYELAKLRKRMKKNAAWAPSDTMIARELKSLGRGIDAYKAAKKKAEEEGKAFEDAITAPASNSETGTEQKPPTALNVESANIKDMTPKPRGRKPKDANNQKQDELAKLAAEEAEESARKMADLARTMFNAAQPPMQDQGSKAANKGRPRKRKRDSVSEAEVEKSEAVGSSSQRPQNKRTKTETPVPPPQLTPSTTTTSQPTQGTPVPASQLTAGGGTVGQHSTTPIPVPIPGLDQPGPSLSATPPGPSLGETNITNALTTTVPIKPAAEAPVAPRKKSITPILPPSRETRKSLATRRQEQQHDEAVTASGRMTPIPPTPLAEPDAQPAATTTARRPASRGKAASQEPQPSLAADRTRRTSTARNTPAPERQEPSSRPASRRARRPAPGVISRTNSGGNSAVGKRKAAPRKKSARASKKAPGGADIPEVEVDDEGNVIDPSEPRYCLCNRVSFGTMIQCDNVDNCKQEWFHLECVGLSDVPARTTKWYCPECRRLLNIGEKGEVNARGVRM